MSDDLFGLPTGEAQILARIQSMRVLTKNIVERHPILSQNKTFANFWWGRMADVANGKKDTSYHAIKEYLVKLSPRMDMPVLHIYGGSGTGKSHQAIATARYIVQNHFSIEKSYSLYMPFEHVYWPQYIKHILNGGSSADINWMAQLMVVEDLDEREPIPKSGSPYWIQNFLESMKPRLELYHLPTIIVTHRDTNELENFLCTNSSTGKKEGGDTKRIALDVSLLIAGSTAAVGKSYGRDIRAELRANHRYIETVVTPMVKEQDMTDYFEETGPTGMPVEW